MALAHQPAIALVALGVVLLAWRTWLRDEHALGLRARVFAVALASITVAAASSLGALTYHWVKPWVAPNGGFCTFGMGEPGATGALLVGLPLAVIGRGRGQELMLAACVLLVMYRLSS